MLDPSAATTARANRRPGTQLSTSQIRITTLSISGTIYPAAGPDKAAQQQGNRRSSHPKGKGTPASVDDHAQAYLCQIHPSQTSVPRMAPSAGPRILGSALAYGISRSANKAKTQIPQVLQDLP